MKQGSRSMSLKSSDHLASVRRYNTEWRPYLCCKTYTAGKETIGVRRQLNIKIDYFATSDPFSGQMRKIKCQGVSET